MFFETFNKGKTHHRNFAVYLIWNQKMLTSLAKICAFDPSLMTSKSRRQLRVKYIGGFGDQTRLRQQNHFPSGPGNSMKIQWFDSHYG